MSANVADLTVRKSITVNAPPERAFEVFTERIHTWWPLATHSLAGERAVTAIVEGWEGGRMYERDGDGNEGYWGTITAWEPPNRIVVSWNTGHARPQPTEFEVRFLPEGEGTRVELEHRGWERRDDGVAASQGYENGWGVVLGKFVETVDRGASD